MQTTQHPLQFAWKVPVPHAVTDSPEPNPLWAPRKILCIKKQETETLEVNEPMALDGREVTGQTHMRECCLSKAFSGRKGASLLPGSHRRPRRILRLPTETTVTDLGQILRVFLKEAS